MATNGIVRPIRFYNKALTGSQLNWTSERKSAMVTINTLS